jgi:hypothetical protein
MTRTTKAASDQAVADNGKRLDTMKEAIKPPAQAYQRPTSKVHRAQFATLKPAEKKEMRERVAQILDGGGFVSEAWATAFAEAENGMFGEAPTIEGAKKFRAESKAKPEPSDRAALYAKAVDRKRKGKRGPGRKMTDDEMVGYIKAIRKAHPETTAPREQEIAYWVEGIALTRDRFRAAWEQAS